MLRIGNAQGFWGDCPEAPARLVQQQPDLDFLTLDYLSEVSMSIMAIQREKDPSLGYARDFLDVIRSLIPLWQKGYQFKVVTNAGGLNPLSCAKEIQKVLNEERCPSKRIAVISGDDVLSILKIDASNPLYKNMETRAYLNDIYDKLVTANVYFGAQPIAEALDRDAAIVITGRTADPSLTVGPCVSHFKWSWNDYDRLAGATIAGHLIECGTQVTGGMTTNWLQIPDLKNIGYPIAEVHDDGSCIITKPRHTGGRVSIEVVKEQLLYEIGDPSSYLSPDATVSFLNLTVEEVGKDRVRVAGAMGKPPPDTFKISATYKDGYKAEALLAIFGPEAEKKAKRCGEIILERVMEAGYKIDRSNIECLGAGAIVPHVVNAENYNESLECVLRICAADQRKEALEVFSKEIAGLITCGPQGVTGYTSGRPHIRPVFGYWPCLIERKQVKPNLQILESV